MRSATKAAYIAAAVLLGVASAAWAQRSSAAGSYQVSFEKVVDNCDRGGRTLSSATVTVAGADDDLRLQVPGLPSMTGELKRGTKVRVKAQQPDGKYSAAGRIEGRNIQFVLTVEHFEAGKPRCTQSWNAQGSRR